MDIAPLVVTTTRRLSPPAAQGFHRSILDAVGPEPDAEAAVTVGTALAAPTEAEVGLLHPVRTPRRAGVPALVVSEGR